MEEQSEGANPYGSRAASPIDFQVTKYVTKSRKRMLEIDKKNNTMTMDDGQ